MNRGALLDMSPDPEAALQSLLEAIEHLLGNVPDQRTRTILAARLGLLGESPTLQALGEQFMVSRERVRQIQENGLRRYIRAARTMPGSALLAGLREWTAQVEPDIAPAFVELSTTLALAEAPPLVIDLLRRLLNQPKSSLAAAREAVTRQRAADFMRVRTRREGEQHSAWVADHVIEAAWWPQEVHGALFARRIAPARNVNADGSGKSGTFPSAKMSRMVQYESSLEAELLAHLEGALNVRSYQEQPVGIPYSWEGAWHTYVPDCLAFLTDGRAILIEVKSTLHMLDAVNHAKLTAAHAWSQRNSCGLILTNGRQCSRQLRLRAIDPLAEQIFCARIAKGPLSWPECRQLASGLGLRSIDLTALGLRNGWLVSRMPWRLYDATR